MDFGVDGIGIDGFHVGTARVERCKRKAFLGRLAQTDHLVVAIEELVDLYFIAFSSERVFLCSFNLECFDDGIGRTRLDGTINGLGAIGRGEIDKRTEQEFVVGLFPIEGLLVHLFSAVNSTTARCAHIACDGQKLTTKQRVGHEHKPLFFVFLHAEQTLTRRWFDLNRSCDFLFLGRCSQGKEERKDKKKHRFFRHIVSFCLVKYSILWQSFVFSAAQKYEKSANNGKKPVEKATFD